MKQSFAGILTLLMIMALSLSSCAGKPAPVSQAQIDALNLKPPPGKALVCYFNNKRFIGSTKVMLEERENPLNYNTYVVWEVDPGKYLLKFHRQGLLPEDVKLTISCEADQVYYFYLIGDDRETHKIVQDTPDSAVARLMPMKLLKRFAGTSATPVAADQQSAPAANTLSVENMAIEGKYYALVIGIQQYQYLEKLPTAVKDARAIADLLQNRYGFEAQFLFDENATRTAILDTLNALKTTLQPDDKLLIYYSGHGMVDGETKTAYWAAVNAKAESATQWIAAETITATIKDLPANQILIVADSCYSGTMERSRHADLQDDARRIGYLKEILTKRSRGVMTNGSLAPMVDKSGDEHSIFANAVLRALTDMKRNVFTAEELFDGSIVESVAGSSAYLPDFALIRNSRHDGGDFIFKQ